MLVAEIDVAQPTGDSDIFCAKLGNALHIYCAHVFMSLAFESICLDSCLYWRDVDSSQLHVWEWLNGYLQTCR